MIFTAPPLVIGGVGLPELLIIGGIVVLIFGARRLPEIGSGLGKAIKGFKRGISDEAPAAADAPAADASAQNASADSSPPRQG